MKQIISPILLFLLLALAQSGSAQSCECTNCGTVVPANTVSDFEFEVAGATNGDLTDPDQGVCGIYIEFAPDHIWTLEMTLIAPSGQRLTLIGPPNNGGFFSGSLTWGITFLPCAETVEPDPGFSPQWNNNQGWTIGSAYRGSYYPFSGCLEDFMAGDVNGTWTLSVNNTSFFNVATLFDFKVVFCDQDGLDCFPCEANPGSLKVLDDVVACPGDPSLELSIRPEYGSDPEPDPSEYGYTFIISQNDTILDYESDPDLRSYASGRYQICGLSYLLEDTGGIPAPDGSLTISEVVEDFSDLIPPFCGAITEDCLEVWIIELDTTYLTETICVDEVYEYAGERYDSSGTYVVELGSANGACDSIVSLDLIVLDSIQVSVFDTICRGEEYCVGPRCFYVDGVYEVVLPSTGPPSCDSLVTLHLHVKESPVQSRSDTICQGDSVVIRGEVFRTTGLHIRFPDPNIPCDTLIELKLEVIDPVSTERRDTLCAGDSLWLEGQFFNTTGAYEIDYISTLGCDSTVRLQLLVLDSIITSVSDTLCAGDTLWIGSDPYFETNEYDIWLRSVRDCDSLVHLNLFVRDNIRTLLRDTLCQGEAFTVGPFELDSTAVYDIRLTSATGCDSLVRVDLLVQDTSRQRLDTVLCRGESLRVGSREFDQAGTYEVGLSSAFGCDSTVVVNLTVLDPVALIDPVDLLACDNNPVRLDATASSGQHLIFQWVDLDNGGSGIVAGADSAVALVQLAGTYQLLLSDTLGGRVCTASTQVGVGGNLDPPQVFAFGDTLSCKDSTRQLNAVVLASGLQFSWTGPDGFTSDLLQPEVNTPGWYTLITTGGNNCRDTSTIEMISDFAPPLISAAALDTLDCVTNLVPLAGSSAASDDRYAWTGPGTFSSNLPNTLAGVPGDYRLLVTGRNGCTADTTVRVVIDTVPPQALVLGDTLRCNKTSGQLMSNFSTAGVSYDWTGPNGFGSNLANPLVFAPGDYALLLTGPNGCTTNYVAEVFADTLRPDLSLQTDTLNCIDFTADLFAMSSLPLLHYSWTGPGGFSNATANPVTTEPGTYYLSVEATNGCSTLDSLVVPLDTLTPTILATGNTLDCQTTMVTILGASSTVGASYSWTGPASFSSIEANPVVTAPGAYVLTVTAPNGCTAVDTAVVLQDGDLPGATAQGDTLDCLTASGQLLGSSPTPGVSYSWTGPGAFSSVFPNPIVTEPGTYTLTVLGPNGCESQATAVLLDDRGAPDLRVETDTLTCLVDSVQLFAISAASVLRFEWTGPGGFSADRFDPYVQLPGGYEVRVVGANACESIDTAWVVADREIPDLIALGDTLTCTRDSVNLLANSNTAGVAYQWTGPGGFSSTEQTPRVGATGIYQLVVTAPNACTATATTEVLEDRTEPGATAVGDTLTCQLGLVTLLGSSPSSPVTYAWTGPGTFNSNIANPSTSIPGRYELRVSGANGCFSLDTAFVASSIDPPGALAQSPDTLNCAIGTVQLLAASPTAGVDYFWRGPDLFSSIDQNPQVSQPGEYILVVTAPNSCRSQDTVVVVADTISPDVLVRNDTLDCQDNLAQLIGSSSTPGVTYDWSGPGGFGSNLPDPTTTDPGVYRLTVTAPNACTATATTEVIEDRDLPDIFVGADTLTCARDTIELRGSSSTLGVAYTWSGPGGFGSNLPQPEVDQAGVYYLTVLAPNACSAQDSIEVFADLDPPGALAEADTINCQNNPASLFGSATSAATDLTFQWTGPSAFSSTLANPLVSEGGLYILEVTAANGCQSRDSVTMLSDIDPPGAFAAVADSLNCVQTTVTLSGNSPTGGVDYFWLGPDLFSSIDQNPTVDRPGTYQLFVSGPNACVSIDMVTVVLDTLRPDAQALGDTLNCQDNSVTLLGSSTTPGVSYSWTGPGGFVALVANPVVTEAGPYELIVRADNGCTAVDTAHVWEDENLPGALALADTLNCIRDTVSLLGSSPTAGVDYFWLGPGSFTSGEQNPRVGREGEYLLFVTGPNGCESHFTLQVIRDTLAPLLSLRADTLDCRTDSVQLQPSSTGRGLTYAWSGPGGFSSTQAAPLVDATGTYTLRVRASNACTAEASIVVLSDTQEPDLMSRGDTLTCARDSVALGATSSTLGVQYQWVGPGGFNSALANPRAGMPGDYYLTATAPNGCSVLDTIAVPLDTLAPEVEALGGILGCQSNGLQLGSVVTPLDTDLRWEGPGGWTSDAPDPLVFISGSYVLVATAGNGCSARDTALVEEDVNLPGASILGDTLTCASDSIRLEGNSPTAMVSYAWTGPGGFGSSLPNPMIAQPGLYTLVVTGPNACQSQEQITIEQDTLSPAFSLSADTLDCNRDSIQLQVSATGSVASYTWTGPGTFVSTIPQPYAFVAGTYQLTAIGTNACVASDSIQVIDASRFPDALARGDTLTCARDTVQLLGISATLDVSYSWTGPGSFASTEQNPRIATAGAYYLTVRSAENCETSDTVLILEDLQVPGALARGDTIDCQSGRVQLVANSPTAGATYSWTGPSGFSSNQQQPEVMVAGDYYLLVTGPNGCASRDTARVLEDLEVPGASIVGDTLDCARDSIPLLGNSPTAGVSYSWTGPGFSSNQQSPRVGAAGLYTLTVVAPNACESVAQFEVLVDTIAPGALAIGDTLDCRFNPLQVSATSPTAGVSYFWEGPGGFSSTLPNPNVAELGTYRLLVRGPNACESRDTVLVIEDIVLPGALAQGDTLTCGIDSIQLLGNSPTPGVSYSWTGPGTYASGLQNPFANRGGTYVLTVRDAEGCISLDSTVLTVDTLAPTFMVFNDTLNCRDTLIALNASSATLGLSYAWTGPGGFQSQLSQPEIDRPGAYFLEVTGPNQCRSRDTLRIEQDILEPGAQALGDTLDCGRDSVDLWAQALVDPVRYAWTGPGGFSSSQRGPRIGMPGWYRLRTEGRNFCQSTDSIFIVQDRSLPEAIALGDTLNCGRDSVQLEGQSTSASAQFSWRGPGGFSSGERDPTVGLSGWYFLTVRGTNDCEAVDSALVETDFEQPDVLALGDTLNCGAPIGQLLGMSATSGVRYTWTGPGGFSAASANPNVSDPGTYILEVVAPNFCEARDTVEVLEDVVLPGATALGGTIDCARDMVQLEGNSVTAGVTYSWTGPDAYSSNQQNPSVATGGSYTLTVTAPNGCESLTSAQVVVDTLPPDLLAFTDTLDCNTGVAEISAQSGTPGVSYDWTGPDGFMANVPNPIVVDSGWYTIVLTAPNFCRDSARVLVVPETNLPLAEAGVAGLLNCEVMRVALDAGASQGEANLAYQWRAADGSPLGNTSMVEVEASGWYFVEVTNPSNACSDLDSVLVGIDTLSPTAFVNPIGGLSLTCSTTSIVLDASGSAGPGALGFEWWWEREAESSEVNYEITRPGQYTLIVTNLENACRDSVAVNIVEDNDLPLILIGPPDILNCRRVVLELDASASSSGNGYVYQWSGPSILSGATTPQARVDQPGIYQLLLTNTSTGCRDSASVRVDADFEFPLAEAGAGGTLDCETLRLSLDGSASSQGSDFAYQWTGPGLLGAGMALRAEVDQAGQYWFTVTDSTNGCTSTDSVLVALGNLGPQDLFIDLVEPTCFGDRDGALLIDSVVGGLGPYLYGLEGEALVSWPTFDRLPVGTYRLTIQDSEGCELDTLVELAGAGPIGVQLGPDTTIQLGQSVELLGQVQSDRPFEFRWAENPWLLCDSCLAQPIAPTRTVTVELEVEDEAGCRALDRQTIYVAEGSLIYVPSAFSPDGDGQNDWLEIFTSSGVQRINRFLIFNRWGAVVHEARDFLPGDPRGNWDGSFRGEPLNPAVFVYMAEVELLGGETRIFDGSITLVR